MLPLNVAGATVDLSFGSGNTSREFRADKNGSVYVHVAGTFSSQTVTLQFKPHHSASWETFAVDLNGSGTAVDQTWTGAAGECKLRRYIMGGGHFRFSVSSGGSPAIAIYVGGNGVVIDDNT